MNEGTRIDALIHANGMRKDWVAKQVNVTPEHLSRVIHGDRPLSPALANRLERLFRVPEGSLLEEFPQTQAA